MTRPGLTLARAALLTAALLAPDLRADERLTESELRAILVERVDRAQQAVGLVAGLIDSEGRVVVGHGRMGPGDGRSPDGRTVFEIGSISKVFTGTLLASLAAEGALSLQDPVQGHLPEPARLAVFEGADPITLYHLATHTSGLPRMPSNFSPADPTNPYADYSVDQLYAFLTEHTPARPPGVRAEYSNLGMGLLGQLLSRRSGSGYEALVRQRITGPLGMADTVIELTPELRARLAHGHDGRLRPVANWDIPTLAGAGGLRSTATDMLQFAAANLGLVESDLAGVMEDARTPRESMGRPGVDIGLAWITTKRHGRTITWHNGQTGGYHSFLGLDIERGRGVVILSNTAADIDDIGFHLLDPRFKLKEPTPPKTSKELPGTPAGRALGSWLEALAAGPEELGAHYGASFAESFKQAVPLEAYLGFCKSLQTTVAKTKVTSYVASGDREVVAHLSELEAPLEIWIQVSPAAPHRIAGLLVRPARPPR